MPRVSSVVKLFSLHFLQVLREGLHPISVLSHDHRVWDDSAKSTGASLEANVLGLVLVVFSVHRRLVRRRLWILQLAVMCDVVWLPSQELLFELLSVDH